MGIDQIQYQAMLARLERNRIRQPSESATDEPESKLHRQIEDWCRQRGWPYVHSRMDKRTTTAVGVPDFIIFAKNGRVLCVEAKRKGRKPTPQQLAWLAQIRKLGHTASIIYSFEEFMELVTNFQTHDYDYTKHT